MGLPEYRRSRVTRSSEVTTLPARVVGIPCSAAQGPCVS